MKEFYCLTVGSTVWGKFNFQLLVVEGEGSYCVPLFVVEGEGHLLSICW